MGPNEIFIRLQKKAHQFSDSKFSKTFDLPLEPNVAWPSIPSRQSAPPELLDALRHHTAEILRGDWRLFGHLPIKVDDPPRWHTDYLVGQNFKSAKPAFKINHRALAHGADIKVIWDLSRWFELVRLAMAGWLHHNKAAQEKCIEWLHDWCRTNPPFTGLNWTSGLEVGLRLINYTWIDAFLTVGAVSQKTLRELRNQILPPHTWYAWRYKSFGSSANNHLIGELAGLIVAQARWPELAKISAPLADLAKLLEREILLQFAEEDGSNHEQALGYHLFSFEFCWQSLRALETANITVSPEVKDRLTRAGQFYTTIKREDDSWPFGDCDNAWVTPLFAEESHAPCEWHRWFTNSSNSPALQFWWGDFPSAAPSPKNQWRLVESSAYATFESNDWFIRFDASPLGYLSMAAHGHLDALHISVSFRGQPIIIDPGTGAYYADKNVRNYFADWSAHNGPHLLSPPLEHPKRFGTFLWGSHHTVPMLKQNSPLEVTAEIQLPYGRATRTVTFLPHTNSIRIRDLFTHPGNSSHVVTRWKFTPNYLVANPVPNTFQVGSGASVIRLALSAEWKAARSFNPPPEIRGKTSPTLSGLGTVPLASIVSPNFRTLAASSFLTLEGSGEGPFELTISPG